MARAMFLEDFDGDGAFAANRPRPEDLPGFADGFLAGKAAANDEAAHISAEIADKITEIQFGYAEARQNLLQSLTPLINALCDQILPDILDDVTRSQIFETLLIAGQADLSAPMSLTVHPVNTVNMQSLINSLDANDLHLIEDPGLSQDEVLIGTQLQETQLDTAAMLDALRKALRMIIKPEMRNL